MVAALQLAQGPSQIATTTGQPIQGISFSGVGYIDIPSNFNIDTDRTAAASALGTWTFSTWIKTTQSGGTMFSMLDGTAGNHQDNTAFYLTTAAGGAAGGVPGAVENSGGAVSGTTTVNNGQWQLVTIVDNNGVQSIYTDGVSNITTGSLSKNGGGFNWDETELGLERESHRGRGYWRRGGYSQRLPEPGLLLQPGPYSGADYGRFI